MNNLREGDRVGYSVDWLRSVGEVPLGKLCHWRGTIHGFKQVGGRPLAAVLWDGEDEVMMVNPANLARVGANCRFCAC